MGNVTQDVIQPAVTGADVLRQLQAQIAAKGNPLGEAAKAIGAISGAIQGIAGGIDGAGSELARDQGVQAGMASVTRDANGVLQIQPHASTLFGGGLSSLGGNKSTGAYERAATEGALAAGQTGINTDINKAVNDNKGDPEAFNKWGQGYMSDLASRAKDSGIGGQLAMHAMERIGQSYNGMISQKATQDVIDSRYAIDSKIASDTNDAYNLAMKGGMTAPEGSPANVAYLKAHASAAAGIQSLGDNKSLGVTPAEVADKQHALMVNMLDADNQGKIDATYKSPDGGAVVAAKQSDDRVNAIEHISEADRLVLDAHGKARLAFNAGQFSDRVATNKAAFQALQTGVANGTITPDKAPPLIDAIVKEAGQTGNPETGADAVNWLRLHHFSPAVTGLSPSQTESALGMPRQDQITAAPQGGDFDYPKYAAGVKAIESGGKSAAVSPTGYTGLYQFGPHEWAQYGSKYGTITNPAAQEAAMRDYTADHYRQMTVSLGRSPNPGEMYLAHQQGVSGATALITNPNTPAGHLVPAANIRANGGDPSAPASQFVQKWETKFASASGQPSVPSAQPAGAPATAQGVSVGGQTFTQKDFDKSPYLLSNVVQKMSEDGKTNSDVANALGTSIKRVLNDGQLPNQDAVMNYMQASSNGPRSAARDAEREEIATKYMGLAAQQGIGGSGAGATGGAGAAIPGGTQAVEALQRQAESIGSIQAQNMAVSLGEVLKKSREQLRNDPTGYAASTLKIPPPPPINYADPQSVAQGLAYRGATASRIASTEPGFSPSALPPQDLPAANNIISNGSVDQKAGLLGAIARLPGPVQQATFDALKTGEDGGSFAQAGRVQGFDPHAAQDILTGMAILKKEPKFAPGKPEFQASFETVLPSTDLAIPDARSRIMDAARAYYAAQMFKAGTQATSADDVKMKEAVNAVTGGVLEYRGTQIIAPTPGMTQEQLQQRVNSLTDAEMHGATVGGHVVPASAFQRSFAVYFTRNPIRFQTVDPDKGLYGVIGGPPDAPSKAVDPTTGHALILNLGQPPQQGTMIAGAAP
jgi:hypothetical protein